MTSEKETPVVSPSMGATPSLGAGLGADTQLQDVIHEFSKYNRATGRTEYGQWGVEFKSENEITIHNDYASMQRGLKEHRCERRIRWISRYASMQ
jgi:hypothetical protein